jgi:hypothetical protein
MRLRMLVCAVLAVRAGVACGGGDDQKQAQVTTSVVTSTASPTPETATCKIAPDDLWLTSHKTPAPEISKTLSGFIGVWRFESRRPTVRMELTVSRVERYPTSQPPIQIGGWFNTFDGAVEGAPSFSCSGCIRLVDDTTLRVTDIDKTGVFTFKIAETLQSVTATREADGATKTFTLERCEPPQ